MALPISNLREKALAAMASQQIDKAELSRRSGVNYHTLDKFLKEVNRRVMAENAEAIRTALGLATEVEAEDRELLALYYQLPPETRQFVIAALRGVLLGRKP